MRLTSSTSVPLLQVLSVKDISLSPQWLPIKDFIFLLFVDILLPSPEEVLSMPGDKVPLQAEEESILLL